MHPLLNAHAAANVLGPFDGQYRALSGPNHRHGRWGANGAAGRGHQANARATKRSRGAGRDAQKQGLFQDFSVRSEPHHRPPGDCSGSPSTGSVEAAGRLGGALG